jgi:Recombination endonuclease VII
MSDQDDTTSANLKAKKRAEKRAWYEANKEHVAAYNKAWQEANGDRKAAQQKARREANLDEVRVAEMAREKAKPGDAAARQKAYRERHPEKVKAAREAYRKANPDKIRLKKKRAYQRNKERIVLYQKCHKYGVTADQFAEMLHACGGRCPCCKVPFSKLLGVKPNIDHCHKTGRVRGILCGRCNFLLGHANDERSILLACARYLRQFDKAHSDHDRESTA